MGDDMMNNSGLSLPSGGKKLQLRNLLTRIELIDESDETGLSAVKDVHNILRELNTLEEEKPCNTRVRIADETLLDAIVMNTASNLVLKCVDAVNLSIDVYEGSEFADKIIGFLNDHQSQNLRDEDYLKLDASNIIREVPRFSPLYGAYNSVQKPKPVKNVKKLPQEQLVKKKLIKVVQSENKEEQSIDETINFLTLVLNSEYEKNGKQPIDYYRYVMDTDDFGETVQNIFYTSFLVRDGKAKLEVDGSGRPILSPISKSELKHYKKNNKDNTQAITSITMDMWQSCCLDEGFLQHHKNNN